MSKNFDKQLARRQYHGRGNYFSESPSHALQYSSTATQIIVSQILPGRQYTGPSRTWQQHYDSKLVYPDANNFSEIVIITEKEQILPLGILHLLPQVPSPRNALSKSFTHPTSATYVPTYNAVVPNPPLAKFNPNIVFPNMYTTSSIHAGPQPSGIQVFSFGQMPTAIGPTSSGPLYSRMFSSHGRPHLVSSLSTNKKQQSSPGTSSSLVGKQLGTIAEAVFKPLLKKKSSAEKDTNEP